MQFGIVQKIKQVKLQWWHAYMFAILLGLGIGGTLTLNTMHSEDSKMRSELLLKLQVIEKSLSWPELDKQSASSFNMTTPEWQHLKRKLQQVCKVTPDCKWMYLMYQDSEHHIRFVFDTLEEDDPNYSPPNSVYDDATPALKAHFQTSKNFVEGPEQDTWGIWVSAFVMHLHPSSDAIDVTLGIDIDAKNWQTSINHTVLTPIIATIAYLALILYLLLLHMRELSKKEIIQSQADALYNHAHYDNLTGLANRILFEDRVKQVASMAQRTSSAFAVLFMDLDGFKYVNDTHGHSVGDNVLIATAKIISEAIRAEDTVARFGGDEFVVLLPRIQYKQQVYLVAQKLIDSLKAPIEINNQSHQLGLSVGFAIYPNDTDDLNQLILLADAAMYLAKKDGKNQARSCADLATSTSST